MAFSVTVYPKKIATGHITTKSNTEGNIKNLKNSNLQLTETDSNCSTIELY